jgi:hypothetical protein
MVTNLTAETLIKIKELRNLSIAVDRKLEDNGMPITNIEKEQLFNYNVKSIISAVESLLRNESQERAKIRLEKDIPDAYSNLKKVKESKEGRTFAADLDKIKEIIAHIERNCKSM